MQALLNIWARHTRYLERSFTHLDELCSYLEQGLEIRARLRSNTGKSEAQDLRPSFLAEECCQLQESRLIRHLLIGLQNKIIHPLWIQVKEPNQGLHLFDLQLHINIIALL